ncbi:MAG TPA: hypothetical protein VGW35_16230 [Methylomirabilota bacterium]|nr:hypothetical protein [Methylomirabilota bacterium]
MASLRLAYLALAGGLLAYGASLIWLGLRRARRPAGLTLRILMVLAVLIAVAGTVAAVILERRAAAPW